MTDEWVNRDYGSTPHRPVTQQLPSTAPGSAAGRLGRYTLAEKVGEGGMGVVYRAIDPGGRSVAIKVLRAHVAHDAGARERLRREMNTLARVRSPHVAEVIDADVDGEQPYLVTRFVPGMPLDDVVDAGGPRSPEQLVRLGRGLIDALGAIHAAGVVHRDVKPGNVMMVGDDPVLIDFGIAHVADDSRLTSTGLVMGTPGYLSPEIVEGAPVTEATDWWGWAATLAYAASGRPPFGTGPMTVVLDRVQRGQADLSSVDPRLAPLLAGALDTDPRRRPTAVQVMDELETFAHGGTTGPHRVAHPPEPPGWAQGQRRRPDPTEQLARPGPVPAAERPRPVAGTAGWQPPAQTVPDGPVWASGQEPWWVDPRIGRPARSWTHFAALVAATAVSTRLPVPVWFAMIAWSFVSRWHDKSVSALVLRRHAARGRRPSDRTVTAVMTPWHALLAILSTILTAIVPAFLAAVAAAATAVGMSLVDPSGAAVLGRPAPLAAATAVAALASWWGPGGTSLRRGSRALVRTVSPNRTIAFILVVALLLVAAAVGLVLFSHPFASPDWWPYLDSSQVPGAGLWPRLPSL